MQKAHVGHVGNGGIQAHSCGPTFPFYVLGIGRYHCAFDPERGLCGPLYREYDHAELHCNQLAGGTFAQHRLEPLAAREFQSVLRSAEDSRRDG